MIKFTQEVQVLIHLLLNNHFLYLLNDTVVVDSVALKGYDRIFVNPNSRKGVAVSTDSLQWFSLSLSDSIIWGKAISNHILIDGCVQKGDTLFVSTEAGVQSAYIDNFNASTLLNANFLTFDRSNYEGNEKIRTFTFVGSIILFVFFIIAWGIWKLKNMNTLIQESMSSRIEELETSIEYIGTNLKSKIKKVRNEFNDGQVKHINSQIDVLKTKVKDELIQCLEKQADDVGRYESIEGRNNEEFTRNLINKKGEVKIEELVACIKKNKTWASITTDVTACVCSLPL